MLSEYPLRGKGIKLDSELIQNRINPEDFEDSKKQEKIKVEEY